jgi:adenylate cyclase
VIGQKKFSYDIWGDTVNTASRMESSGEAMKINISGQTYEMVKDFFICEYRGKMPVKYKGEVDMYFVKGIRPELSVDLYKIPNKNFFIQLQKLRLADIEEFIFQFLETDQIIKLPFHNHRHTMEQYSLVELLGRAEGLPEEDLLLARTAALFMDTGYVLDYSKSNEKSNEFARQKLPRYKYSESQILQVEQLILSEQTVNKESSIIEKILADARTIYYGRVDFIPMIENLFNEMLQMEKFLKKDEWVRNMVDIISEHEYFTETARRLREINKEEQISLLIKLV